MNTDKPREKSIALAYVLWLALDWLGAHHFYLEKPRSALLYSAAFFVGFLTSISLPDMGVQTKAIIFIAFLPYTMWRFVDLFTIPRQVRAYNAESRAQGAANADTPSA